MTTVKHSNAGAAGLWKGLAEIAPLVERTLEGLERQDVARRIWAHDPTLWKPNDPAHQKIIANRLGWLDVTDRMRPRLSEIEAFAATVRADGFTHALVLGMGGSTLCAEVLRRTLGIAAGWLDLAVLDSTHPASVRSAVERSDPAHTLYIVASKSGTTVEANAFFSYFYELVSELKDARAGENFVAITDPGTELEARALERGFRHVFTNLPDIGGRYSALSYFGLVPAALIGASLTNLLDRADAMRRACGPEVPARENPSFVLGAALAEAAQQGRDKVTLMASPQVASLGDWIEQLLAESTGKEGKGLIPVVGEPIGSPEAYGNDRLLVNVRMSDASDTIEDLTARALHARGTPLVSLSLADKLDVGGEFFRWEMATAVACMLLDVDPFDEPDVKQSKDNTALLLDEYERTGKLPGESWFIEEHGIAFLCGHEMLTVLRDTSVLRDGPPTSLAGYLSALFALARERDYIALMAYLDRTEATDRHLTSIRRDIRDRLHLATTLGYGPRFLHSTGQLHKGGPPTGLFIQITEDYSSDVPIPGETYTFAVLNRAQAIGDLKSLSARGRRAVRLHLSAGAEDGFDALAERVRSALEDLNHAAQGGNSMPDANETDEASSENSVSTNGMK
jgi:transaldolase/glucose-6-phosphate isomerase